MTISYVDELELVVGPSEARISQDTPRSPTDRFADADPEVWQTLRSIQELLMRFPMATQRAFSALVAEGRSYAETEEGARLLVQLTHSKKANRARVVWEVLTLSGITDQRTLAVPSLYLDKIARTLVVERLEPFFSGLFDRKSKADS